MKVSVAWYRESQWGVLKNLSVDREILPDTFDEWLREANKSCRAFGKRKGLDVVKADVDVLAQLSPIRFITYW